MNIWKQIENLDYEINNKGEIRRISTKRLKKNQRRKDGYYQNQLMIESKKYKMYQVHILVAKYFIPNPLNKPFVNHIDGDRGNYNVSNLEWVTHSENMKHSYKIGLSNSKGSNNGFSKLNEDKVRYIRSSNKAVTDLANELGVAVVTIKNIKYRSAWKHVK